MAVQNLRKKEFKPSERAVPLEYFEWERVLIDEIHESLCTTKVEMSMAKQREEQNPGNSGFFTEKNRRAGRELLGITQKDIRRRPLIHRRPGTKGAHNVCGQPSSHHPQRALVNVP